MSRYSLLWQQKLADREKATKSEAQQRHCARLSSKQYKKEHDALEKAVEEFAAVKFGIKLYKTDSEAVVVICKKCGEKTVRKGRATSGLPDRIGCIPPTGRMLTVEIKIRSSDLRANQSEIESELLKAGAAAIVVGSLDEADDLLTELVRIERKKWRERG